MFDSCLREVSSKSWTGTHRKNFLWEDHSFFLAQNVNSVITKSVKVRKPASPTASQLVNQSVEIDRQARR